MKTKTKIVYYFGYKGDERGLVKDAVTVPPPNDHTERAYQSLSSGRPIDPDRCFSSPEKAYEMEIGRDEAKLIQAKERVKQDSQALSKLKRAAKKSQFRDLTQ